MLAPDPNVFRWGFSNATAPTNTPGTSVTPGATNAEGSATVIATSSDITEDVYELLLTANGGTLSATSKAHLLDVGVDPAGGTSYDWVVENLQVGGSGSFRAGGRTVRLPIFIPAGSQVAVRIQGQAGTAGTVLVYARFYGRPTHPELVWCGSHGENLGTISSSGGPTVTPGTSGAEGTWTNIGTTTERLKWLYVGIHIDDSTANAQTVFADVAINVGGTRQIIATNIPFANPGSAEVQVSGWPDSAGFFCDVPPGADLDVRLSTDLATADSNYRVNLVGLC